MAKRPVVHLAFALLVFQLDQDLVAGTTSCSQLCHYVSWARDADCSRRHLDQVPVQCLGSKVLNLNKNSITVVPTGVFSSFMHLKYLQMLENNIQTVSAYSFAGARKLKSVNLVRNALTVVQAHTFNDTAGLRWVYLSKNTITSIEVGVFQESPHIQILYLDHNHLSHLRVDVFRDLTGMQRLLLGDNRLEDLPPGVFQDMRELDYLDLSRNQLQRLSEDTFSGLSKLKTVKISGNRLVEIAPRTFFNSPVTVLDISGNSLKTLPWDESDFESMEEIEGVDNPWVCDCSLEPFRAVMVRLSGGIDSTAICAGPPSLAHTDIVSHATLCPDPTSRPPTSKMSAPQEGRLRKAYMLEDAHPTDEVPQIVDSDATMMITLMAVASFTVLALVAMGMILLLTCVILPRRRKEKTLGGEIKNTRVEVTLGNPPADTADV